MTWRYFLFLLVRVEWTLTLSRRRRKWMCNVQFAFSYFHCYNTLTFSDFHCYNTYNLILVTSLDILNCFSFQSSRWHSPGVQPWRPQVFWRGHSPSFSVPYLLSECSLISSHWQLHIQSLIFSVNVASYSVTDSLIFNHSSSLWMQLHIQSLTASYSVTHLLHECSFIFSHWQLHIQSLIFSMNAASYSVTDSLIFNLSSSP